MSVKVKDQRESNGNIVNVENVNLGLIEEDKEHRNNLAPVEPVPRQGSGTSE